jgi:Cu(I)/Ag(I) efflux system protein CusF
MKFATLSLILGLTLPILSVAQTGGMAGMDMKDRKMKKCMDMMDKKDMKGMNMEGMDSEKCMSMMKEMEGKPQSKTGEAITHHAKAVVKSVNADKSKVTLAHEPIKSLHWPAMTMSFDLKDKALAEKLVTGQKVDVEFVKQGSAYVVTAVK